MAWNIFGRDTTPEQLPAELRAILADMKRERVAFENLTNTARESGTHLTQLMQPITEAQLRIGDAPHAADAADHRSPEGDRRAAVARQVARAARSSPADPRRTNPERLEDAAPPPDAARAELRERQAAAHGDRRAGRRAGAGAGAEERRRRIPRARRRVQGAADGPRHAERRGARADAKIG